jgi:hypothetical protein
MGEALERYDQRVAVVAREGQRIERLHKQQCPPDPELDALFQEFAQCMPRSEAVPFVIEREEDQKKEPGNFFMRMIRRNIAGYQLGKEGRVLPTIREIDDRRKENLKPVVCSEEEVVRGWPIRANGVNGTVLYDPINHERVGVWAGLAIDTDGRLWLARDARKIAPDGLSWDGYRTDEDRPVAIGTEKVSIKAGEETVQDEGAKVIEEDPLEYEIYTVPLVANALEYLVTDVKTGMSRNVEVEVPAEEDGEKVPAGKKPKTSLEEEDLKYKRRHPKLGTPTGGNLRETIMWFCGIRNVAPDELTKVLAQVFAKTIRDTEAKAAREAAKRQEEAAQRG